MQFHRTTTASHSRSRSPRLHSYRTRYTRQREQAERAHKIIGAIWLAFWLAAFLFFNTTTPATFGL